MAKKIRAIDTLRSTLPPDWLVCTQSTGASRLYRFFYDAPPGQMFHGPNAPVYTAEGLKEAHAFAIGVAAGSVWEPKTIESALNDLQHSVQKARDVILNRRTNQVSTQR